jgi:S1-C subfamily serine protease
MQTQKSWLIGLVVAVLLAGCSLTACLAGALIGGAVGGRIGYSMAEDRAPVARLSLPTWAPDWSEPPYQVPPGSKMRLVARVINVTPGGPADEAGIRPGDLILAVDDQQISLARDVADIIRDYKPGDRVQLTFLRDGREERLRVRLGRRLNDDGAVVAALDLTYRLEPVMLSR